MGKLDGKIDAVFADMAMPQHPGAALIIRFLDTQRTIVVLTNRGPIAPASEPRRHSGIPGPRVRAHQVAEILFRD